MATSAEELPTVGYIFRDGPYGFVIEGRDRTPVEVILHKDRYQFEVRFINTDYPGAMHSMLNRGIGPAPSRVMGGSVSSTFHDLMSCYEIISQCGRALMYRWESPKHERGENPWYGVRDWVRVQAARAVASRVRDRWKRLLETHYEPELVALMRRTFHVTFRSPASHMVRYLHQCIKDDPLMVEDIMNHRAAAHAVFLSHRLTHQFNSATWMDVYASDDAGLDRSKRRTIMNLPHAVPTSSLYGLAYISMREPLFTRLSVTWAGTLGRTMKHNYWDPSVLSFLYATDDDLIRASEKFLKHMGSTDKPSTSKAMISMAQYLMDFLRDSPRGTGRRINTVNAAVKRSIDWHREIHIKQFAAYYLPVDESVMKPPVDLPENSHITFLSTYNEIVRESEVMNHCVYMYADNAQRGTSFLFHTEYDGEMATTEVSASGTVKQSYGPMNTSNKASGYATRVLSDWGAQVLKKHLEEIRQKNPFTNTEPPRLHAINIDENGLHLIEEEPVAGVWIER